MLHICLCKAIFHLHFIQKKSQNWHKSAKDMLVSEKCPLLVGVLIEAWLANSVPSIAGPRFVPKTWSRFRAVKENRLWHTHSCQLVRHRLPVSQTWAASTRNLLFIIRGIQETLMIVLAVGTGVIIGQERGSDDLQRCQFWNRVGVGANLKVVMVVTVVFWQFYVRGTILLLLLYLFTALL